MRSSTAPSRRSASIGAVVLVAHDGETIHARSAGLADREAGVPMRPDAIVRLASVSKLFTAAAVMVLVAEGRLDLDRPIIAWLPDFRPTFAGAPATITLRHLLSHSAGLSYGFLEPADGAFHRAGISDGLDRSELTLAENLRRLGSMPLAFAPGTGFRHSLGLDVAGAILEAASGLSLPEAMRRLVTAPAGVAEPAGTWRWGGAYGHSWFVDPHRRMGVVALTNTAFEGMSNAGRFAADLSRAIYAGAYRVPSLVPPPSHTGSGRSLPDPDHSPRGA